MDGMKILVTGFEPFDGATINPALEAVKRLPETVADAEVVKVELPVVFGREHEVLSAAVAEHKPDAVVCIGQAGGRTHITPEFVGSTTRTPVSPITRVTSRSRSPS